jgi:hypothetical protein
LTASEPDQRTVLVTRPAFLRGQLAISSLVEQQLAKRTGKSSYGGVSDERSWTRQGAAQVQTFDQQAEHITLKTLTEERAALVEKNPVAHAEDIALLDHEIADLQSGSNGAASVMLHSASGEDDVQTATHR